RDDDEMAGELSAAYGGEAVPLLVLLRRNDVALRRVAGGGSGLTLARDELRNEDRAARGDLSRARLGPHLEILTAIEGRRGVRLLYPVDEDFRGVVQRSDPVIRSCRALGNVRDEHAIAPGLHWLRGL